MLAQPVRLFALLAPLSLFAACGDSDGRGELATAQSCMSCHNGSQHNDYAGPGLENPHPFGVADQLLCTTCHGGNPDGTDKDSSHVPPPPEIGDREFQQNNRKAHFNRLTLAGIDKYADYTVDGQTHTALEWLQFVNPGDLRVISQGEACGQCHRAHAECTVRSPLATTAGIFSGAMFAAGVDNQVPENVGLYEDTAADLGWRSVIDPAFALDPSRIGPVARLIEVPVHSLKNIENRPVQGQIRDNPDYLAGALVDDVNAQNQLITDSPLHHLYQEQISFTCGDCHLGSAGNNNRAGDYRSSGCTACHMPYSLSGRTGSRDPNVNREEPANPDDLNAPERSHVRSHQIRSVARTLPNGHPVEGIDDLTCAGCHQGSNRTVMQFWGIRLDQNQDVRNGFQYPANPASFQNTRNDERLFDPDVNNNTFNGRNANQYLAFEDYDGDGLDDTPADVHHEAGMGCVDCHGSFDLHGGDITDPAAQPITSRMEHSVAIECEDCHGSATTPAATIAGTTYEGRATTIGVDSRGNPLRHVERDGDGHYWLTSRLTGDRHYLPQTVDTIVDSGKLNPLNGEPIYNAIASYAMGRDDGLAGTGLGPEQIGDPHSDFSHMDNMSCASCHSAWTNTCMGCHLIGDFNGGNNNFSNITGETIVFEEEDAQFTYQSPLMFQLGVGPNNKIVQTSANTKVFFRYIDQQDTESDVYAFTDRKGRGNNPAAQFPSMSHNAMLAHSIRGRVTATDEGPRYCVACHLTQDSLANFGAQYDTFRNALNNRNYAALDQPMFDLLQTHIGRNTSNQLDSPFFVHMVAGLGTGLFLFDEDGCPTNLLDDNPNRAGCVQAPTARGFNPADVFFDLDRVVELDGTPNGSNNHALELPLVGPSLRAGMPEPMMAGPLPGPMVLRLTDPNTGIVLRSWFDADAVPRGNLAPAVPGR